MFHAEHDTEHRRRHDEVKAVGLQFIDTAGLPYGLPPEMLALLKKQSMRSNLSTASAISVTLPLRLNPG